MTNKSATSKFHFPVIFQALLVGIFILFLVLVVLQQANPLNTKLGRDSGIYIYVSNTLLKGGLPYVSAMETKPPGIFFIDAFALSIGDGTRWGIWLVEFLFLFGAACIGFYVLHKQFGFGPAFIGTTVWLLGLNMTLEGGNLTEEYSLLFGFGALLFWILSKDKPRVFWFDVGIGLCTGLSVLIRPNNAGVQAAIVLVMAFFYIVDKNYRTLFMRLGVIGITAAIPLILSGLYFHIHGAFIEFLEASILYNLSYAGGNIDLPDAFLSGIGSLGFSSGIALIGCFVAVDQLRRQSFDKNKSPFLLWLLVDGVLEVFLSGLAGRNYQHYFICWLPFIASATAVVIYYVFSSFCLWVAKHTSRFALISIGFALLLYSNVPGDYIKSAKYLWYQRSEGVQRPDPVAEYINAHTTANDLVLVWGGQAGINFLSKRDAPTPYIFYPLFVPSRITDRIAADYYREIQETPPVLIVDGSSYSPADIISLEEKNPLKWSVENGVYADPYLVEVMKFIRENYSLKNVVNGVPIYEFIR